MVMLGCTPKGRNTEQHDVFFGIANTLTALVPQMNMFWKEAEAKLHIDAWREVTCVDGYTIDVTERQKANTIVQKQKLFFINLGGYKQNEFEEYHYKLLAVAYNKSDAVKRSKETAFYKHCGFKGAASHIDDKYGIDVDDVYEIDDVLPAEVKKNFSISLVLSEEHTQDELHIGYLKLDKIS